MTNLDSKFWDLVQENIEAGFIDVKKHPTEELYIYNYTPECMFSGTWNLATMNCRGLIVDKFKNIVARPFPKFFNYEQTLPEGLKIPLGEKFKVYDKLDGSMGCLYHINDIPYIATRGSFESDQAKEATKILREKYSDVVFRKDLTFIFEIIYPENRIVVDYKNKRDLILLGIIETATGKDINLDSIIALDDDKIEVVKRYDLGDKQIDKLIESFSHLSGTEFEGLVLRFENGFRVKIKTEDYKKLHKIYTGLSERDIWDCLSSGIGLDDIIKTAPDEMYDWIKQVSRKLENDYLRVETISKMLYNDGIEVADKDQINRHQKAFALFVTKCDNPVLRSVAFNMYRKLDYKKIIWKHIYPEGSKRFRVVNDIG